MDEADAIRAAYRRACPSCLGVECGAPQGIFSPVVGYTVPLAGVDTTWGRGEVRGRGFSRSKIRKASGVVGRQRESNSQDREATQVSGGISAAIPEPGTAGPAGGSITDPSYVITRKSPPPAT